MQRPRGAGPDAGQLAGELLDDFGGRRRALVVREPQRPLPGRGLRRAVQGPPGGAARFLGVVRVPDRPASDPGTVAA